MAVPKRFDVLGKGWNTLEDSLRDEILRFTYNELGATNECNIYKCESIEDIIENLDIRGSVSVDHPIVTVEAETSFLKECSKKSHAITLLVKVRRTWQAMIQNAVFKKDDDLRPIFQNAAKLLGYAGDSYISQIEVGTEYYSEDEKVPDVNHAIKFAMGLTAKNIPNPQVLKFKTTPYSTLPSGPPGLSDVERWISANIKPTLGWYPYSVKAIAQQAQFVLGRSQAASTLYNFYNAQDELQQKPLAHCDRCSQIIDDLQAWKVDLIQRLSTGKWDEPPEKPEVDLDFFSVPYPQFDLIFGDTRGRQGGGSPWFDFDDEMVYSFGYPKTFRCKGFLVLDSLITVYGYRNPEDPTNPEEEAIHEIKNGGEAGGDVAFNYTFSPGQIRYTGLWSKAYKTPGESDRDLIQYADLVCGFEVYVQGDSQSKLMGRKDGPWTGNAVPENSFFLGFQGRSGSQIDVLQPVYVKFKEPAWEPSLPRMQSDA